MHEWDLIAKSFDQTRKKPWKECIKYINTISGYSIDIGCGNGRHLVPMSKKCDVVFGIDYSTEMIKISQKKIFENKVINTSLVKANACFLPFNNDTFNHALFIASLHNISGQINRIKALNELFRVLIKDGSALISVWSKWQDKYRSNFIFDSEISNENGDIYIPWKKNGVNIPRYYHLYDIKEFECDIKKSGLSIIELWGVKISSKKHDDNYFALVKK